MVGCLRTLKDILHIVIHLVQKYSFVVNIVSRDGKHVVTDMWKKYNTEDQECIYDKEILCNNSKDHSDIVDYVVDVFDALGIRHGPSHVEVMRVVKNCIPSAAEMITLVVPAPVNAVFNVPVTAPLA